jgi:hypothetical protein
VPVKQETRRCLQRRTRLGGRRRRHSRVRTTATLAADNRSTWGKNVEVTALQGIGQPNVPKRAKRVAVCKRRKKVMWHFNKSYARKFTFKFIIYKIGGYYDYIYYL